MILFVWLLSLAQAEMWQIEAIKEQIDWWSVWGDPQLSKLIDQGLENSPDVKMAWGRLEQSKAAAGQMRAGFIPSLSASVSTNSQPSDALGFGFGLSNLQDMFPEIPGAPAEEEQEEEDSVFTSATMALNLSLPLDIYGSNYSMYQAAQKEASATAQDRINILRRLSFGIANFYYDLILVQKQKEIVENQILIVSNILKTTEARHQRTEASILDVLQQRQQVSSMEAQLIQIQQMEQNLRYQLAFLIGEKPSYPIETSADIPMVSALTIADYDSWVSGRPDVQAAELRLISAEKRKYNAMTQVLPQLAVGGKLSRQANYRGADEEDTWDTLDAWSVSTSASVVLFQGGGQVEKIRSANAGVVMAEENLRKVKLQAKQELAQSLLGEKSQEELLNATKKQTDDALLAYEEARNQYLKGVTPFVSVMTTQQVARQAEFSLVQRHREMIRTRFQTYITLGYSDAGGKK